MGTFDNYKHQIELWGQKITGLPEEVQLQFYSLTSQLNENINRSLEIGDTESLRNDRYRILGMLNKWTLQNFACSFADIVEAQKAEDAKKAELKQRLELLVLNRIELEEKNKTDTPEFMKLVEEITSIKRDLRYSNENQPGDILGRIKLIKPIGKGGFGTVWEGWHLALRRKIAVKILNREHYSNTKLRERFLHGAQAMARLDHPNIVKVFEIYEGKDPLEPLLFFTMELIVGKPLDAYIINKRLGLAEKLIIIHKISEALSYAHENGIIHRDISPGNIIITEEGIIKLTDFDLAQVEGFTRLTSMGEGFGTLRYCAPEQQSIASHADERADVFGLGMVLYHILVEREPFIGEYLNPDAMFNALLQNSIPPYICIGVIRATALSTSARFQTMLEFGALLQQCWIAALATERPDVIANIRAFGLKSLISTPLGIDSDQMPDDQRFPPSSYQKLSYKNPQGFYELLIENISLIWIPSGDFWLGDEDDWLNKKKMKLSYLDGYWIGRYLITNDQFKQFIQESNYVTEAEKIGTGWAFTKEKGWHWLEGAYWRDPEGLKKGIDTRLDFPVLQLSWYDAHEYVEWLSHKVGSNFKIDLPAQNQWEKAARGIDRRLYPWGDDIPTPLRCNMEWIRAGHSEVNAYEEFGVSPFGCCDMSGNVWEWTSDGFKSGLYRQSINESPQEMKLHKLRGGSWDFSGPENFSISAHLDVPLHNRYRTVGFRIVATPKQ